MTILKITLLFYAVLFLTGCPTYEVEGDTVAILYPSKDIARVRTITNSCPLKTSSATMVAITELPDAGCWIPPEQCAKYTRDYEDKACD